MSVLPFWVIMDDVLDTFKSWRSTIRLVYRMICYYSLMSTLFVTWLE